jgi:hypothetical protein
MEVLIRFFLLLAYLCYVHPHVELQIVKKVSNSNTQVFMSMRIVVCVGYVLLAIQ